MKQKGTEAVAEEYLRYLYEKDAQEIIAKNFYRPSDPEVFAKYTHYFKPIEFFDISLFGGWQEAQKRHFSDGGEFDKIFEVIKSKK